MHRQVPKRFFLEDHAVCGEPGDNSILSGIQAVDYLDLFASGDQALIVLESDIRLTLGCLEPDERLQRNLLKKDAF